MIYKKPHLPVNTSTMTRWYKNILPKAGIDIESYASHSTRSATLAKLKWGDYQWQKSTELLDGIQIQPLENSMVNPFIGTMGIQLFRLNIIQHVQSLYLYIL